MRMNLLRITAATMAVFLIMVPGSVFAASLPVDLDSITVGTIDPAPVQIDDILIRERGASGFGEGFFRLVIPSEVRLASLGGEDAIDTEVFGSVSDPRDLKISEENGVFVDGIEDAIFTIFEIDYDPVSRAFRYGPYGLVMVKFLEWTAAEPGDKIGDIYFDDITHETVLTLVGTSDITSPDERILISGLTLMPAVAGSTGRVNLSLLDGDVDGADPIGVTEQTGIHAMTLTRIEVEPPEDPSPAVTVTTVSDTPVLMPGVAALPDIMITEAFSGALAAGDIAVFFPETVTLDDGSDVTVTLTWGTSEAETVLASIALDHEANMFRLTLDEGDLSDADSGVLIITISGLEAEVTVGIAGPVQFQITGYELDGHDGVTGSDAGARPTEESVTFGSLISATEPFVGSPVLDGTTVAQTLVAAETDFDRTGDIYVFVLSEVEDAVDIYWTGEEWTNTSSAYLTRIPIGVHEIEYDVAGLDPGTEVYIGYGAIRRDSEDFMFMEDTLMMAWEVDERIRRSVGLDPGYIDQTIDADEPLRLLVNITNRADIDDEDIVMEWLAVGVVSEEYEEVYFFTMTDDVYGLVPYSEDFLEPDSVSFDAFDHRSDTYEWVNLSMSDIGLTSGDTLAYAYVFTAEGIDTPVIENLVVLNIR